jgi:transposase
MPTQRKSYSRQFKIDAVKLVTDHGYKISEAARNLEINPNLLGKWKNQLAAENDQAFPGKGHMAPEKEELHRLRMENQRLRMEHEILKKAAAFFAKESM